MKTYSQKISEVARIAGGAYPMLPYHNFQHALEVWCASREYGMFNGLEEKDRFLLESAALLHDVVYVVNACDNEEKSAKFARKWLPMLGYHSNDIERISRLILATKWPTNPQNLLEEIICDSDLDNLGRLDFFEKSNNLLLEWGIQNRREWYERQLGFLENNQYYTYWAKKLREPGKQRNIQKLKQLQEVQKC